MRKQLQERPKALFFDVDGTIVWHKPDVSVEETVATALPSPAVMSAFRELREHGHRAFICTGRSLALVTDGLRSLDVAGLVTADGACVSVGGEVVSDVVIPRDLLLEVAERAFGSGVLVTFEGTYTCVTLAPASLEYEGSDGIPVVNSIEELRASYDMKFSKFVMAEEQRDLIMAEHGDFFSEHFDLFDLGLPVFEMTKKGMHKGVGIRTALGLLGMGAEDAYAFGDSENDLGMRDAVGTFVAMGNALPQVKAVADYVTDSVEQDGVVAALRHFGLIA